LKVASFACFNFAGFAIITDFRMKTRKKMRNEAEIKKDVQLKISKINLKSLKIKLKNRRGFLLD